MAATDRMEGLARQRTFAVDTSEVRRARRFVTDFLSTHGLDRLVADAELAVSELFGNAVRHSRSATTVEVRIVATDHAVRVEVGDDGSVPHEELSIADPVPEDPTGRGLMVVGMLASEWGVEHPEAAGTVVWFELAR